VTEEPVMSKFDPSQYLTKVGTADYLEVKYRLLWVRTEHPDATIQTELVHFSPGDYAIFKATIILTTGGSATGWGEEDSGDFRDFVEKAETKSLGRALAALGFGTQFTPDFDFGAERQRVVDSPVDATTIRAKGQAPQALRTVTDSEAAAEQAAAVKQQAEEIEMLRKQTANAANAKDTEASQAREKADADEIVSVSTLDTLKEHAKAYGWGVATLQSEARLQFGVTTLTKLTNQQARQLWRAAKSGPAPK